MVTHSMQRISAQGSAYFYTDVSVGWQVDGALYWYSQGVGIVLCRETFSIYLV